MFRHFWLPTGTGNAGPRSPKQEAQVWVGGGQRTSGAGVPETSKGIRGSGYRALMSLSGSCVPGTVSGSEDRGSVPTAGLPKLMEHVVWGRACEQSRLDIDQYRLGHTA